MAIRLRFCILGCIQCGSGNHALAPEQRQRGVWQLDPCLKTKLRQLGDRADKFKMMQRALKLAGINRAAYALVLFERAPRKRPLIGNVIGVGMVDEINRPDLGHPRRRRWPRPLRRAWSAQTRRDPVACHDCRPGWRSCAGEADGGPSLTVLSPVAIYRLTARGRWRVNRDLARMSGDGIVTPKPPMMAKLGRLETERLVQELSIDLKADCMPPMPGTRIAGISDRDQAAVRTVFPIRPRRNGPTRSMDIFSEEEIPALLKCTICARSASRKLK